MSIKAIDRSLLRRTVDMTVTPEELEKKLAKGEQLRIKYGVDVTGPFMHIGHAVNLWLMRHFQEAGHKVVFLIGDFTTLIGDPTGKSATRKIIDRSEIDENAARFIEQVGQILLTDPEVFEIRRNSEWFGKMQVDEFLGLLSMVTHSRLIQRDMFQKRIAEGAEIYLHEMLYPILQGYDSYMLKSDMTIVGSDQLFNEIMGRFYQERLGQPPQLVLTTKITPGTDGLHKQSKSIGNYIAVNDSPRDMYGKAMSIPDRLIRQYLEVYTEVPLEEVDRICGAMESGEANPVNVKKQLAAAIVERYYGRDTAEAEAQWFSNAFSAKVVPEDIPVLSIIAGENLMATLARVAPDQSNSDLRRLLKQGAVSLNERKVPPDATALGATAGDVLKIGKRKWFRFE